MDRRNMAASQGRYKIKKENGQEPTEIELDIGNALAELENSLSDIRYEVAEMCIAGAKEVNTGGLKNAVIVFLPYRVWRVVRKIQTKLIREVEKKLQKKQVVFIAQRTILNKNFRRANPGMKIRPRSRTLSSVHDSFLEDMVCPTEITGKRLRVGTDGSKLLKVYLDPKDKDHLMERLQTYTTVYKNLTNKDVEFLFMEAM